MTPEEAVKILKQHNAWRRDREIPNSVEMVDPTKLGEAYDLAITAIETIINA